MIKKIVWFFAFLAIFISIAAILVIQEGLNNIRTTESVKVGSNKTVSDKPLEELIGVSKKCIYVWQIITAEGFWPGEKEPECSQKDIDKVEEYCKDNTDTCYDYNVESP